LDCYSVQTRVACGRRKGEKAKDPAQWSNVAKTKAAWRGGEVKRLVREVGEKEEKKGGGGRPRGGNIWTLNLHLEGRRWRNKKKCCVQGGAGWKFSSPGNAKRKKRGGKPRVGPS